MATGTDQSGQQQPLTTMLARHLCAQLDDENIAYDKAQSDQLPYIAQRYLNIPKMRRVDLEDEVADFYARHAKVEPDLYTQLARLPFYLAVNLSPDDYLARALRNAGRSAAQTAHYHFRKDRNTHFDVPTVQKPLVFNLLGNVSDPESLILTEEDRVDFIKNIVRGNPDLPNAVMSHFDERKTYVFLGLNLENWDYRLLFDALKVKKENMSFLPQPAEQAFSAEAQAFFEDRYKVMFIDAEPGHFIAQMEQHYTEIATGKSLPDTTSKRLIVLFDPNEMDRQCVNSLQTHLGSWISRGILEFWHPEMVFAGDKSEELASRLQKAHAVMPILSAGFLADDQLMHRWWPEVKRLQKEKGLRIIPLLHRACDWQGTDMAQYASLPEGGKPLRNWPDEDAAFMHVLENLKKRLYDQA